MFGVQVVLKYFIEDDPDYEDYEELTLTVQAGSPSEAVEKAKQYALGYCAGYQNCYHETVSGEICGVLDAFACFEEEGGVQEVYAKRIGL